MNLLERIRGDVEGAKLLSDWLGEGGIPVGLVKSQSRANICETCPHNVEAKWWDRVKHKIADTIKAQLELKHHMELSVSNENKLGMCSCCGCAIPLKVHTPIEHIKDHTPVEVKYPHWCWITQEANANS